LPLLTPREREILELIDGGLMNKEIAKALSIELTTVKNHVHHILGEARRVSPRGRCRESTQAGTPISQHPAGS